MSFASGRALVSSVSKRLSLPSRTAPNAAITRTKSASVAAAWPEIINDVTAPAGAAVPHPALVGSLTTPDPTQPVRNFSPGPTSLPPAVMSTVLSRLAHPQSGLSSMAMSHRSPEFYDILTNTVSSLRRVMRVPDTHTILFTNGGGHGQFAAVPLNLCPSSEDIASYVVSGTWATRAVEDAERYCRIQQIKNEIPGDYSTYPNFWDDTKIDPESKYLYLCSNETVNGLELHRLPPSPHSGNVPLVVDASSDFASKPIHNWDDVGVLFACASKNIGHPGVTVTIIRNDLLGHAQDICPGVFNYALHAEGDNLWNTIATFNVEVIGIMFDWIEEQGGIEEMERRSILKSKLVYDAIDASDGFYGTPVADVNARSRMNVPFNVAMGDDYLTDKFVIEAWEQNMVGLRTMTPFGVGEYLRASLYHGVGIDDVEKLVDFMQGFAKVNR